tara:strand:- start:2078 stop:2533 length:456 start_codon:yes stop_codon:yes gene_type:complete
MLQMLLGAKCTVTSLVIIATVSASPALAQTCSRAAKLLEVRPLKATDQQRCPLGYLKDSSYCIPNPGGGPVLFAIKQIEGKCPHEFTRSGSFCLSPSGYSDFVIEKRAGSCPRGWITQMQSFCVKPCPPFDPNKSRQLNKEVELLRKLIVQ